MVTFLTELLNQNILECILFSVHGYNWNSFLVLCASISVCAWSFLLLHSRTNHSPPVTDASTGNKPGTAKRSFSKRPSMPPPARPNPGTHSTNADTNPKSSNSSADVPPKPATAPKPAPHPKPRAPARRIHPPSDANSAPRRPPLSNIDFVNPPPPLDDIPPIPEEIKSQTNPFQDEIDRFIK